MKHIFAIMIMAAASSMTLLAQRAYTLEECIGEAITNNVRIKNADNDIASAEHGKKEALTNYFPSVSASGAGFIANKGLLELDVAPGTSLDLAKDGVLGGISASMPIFTGGRIVNGNKLAQVNLEASRLQRRLAENEVRLTTERYFWQIVTLKEKLLTITAIETQLDTLSQDVETAVDAGLTNRNDLLQVRLRRNEMRSNRIAMENALSVLRRLLAQYMGHDADSIDVVHDTHGNRLPERPDGLLCNHQSALMSTSEYNLLQKDLEVGRLQLRSTRGKYMPTVAVGGGYMYDNLLDKDHPFWIGFASVSIPISDWWGGSHNVKKQKLQVRNAENRLADQSELLLIGMENAWNEVTDAYTQVEIALESIGQADENLRLQTDYYNAGTCTMSDLLEAQSLYRQCRDRYVESYAQYEIKKREYLQATGR